MKQPLLIAGAAAVAAGLAFAAPAHAGATWSVSIGGPGYAVAAGPAYYPYAYHPYHHHRHWHHAYAPAPLIYPAPVVVRPRVVYRAPMMYAPVAYATPRVVYPAPVVVRPW
jgi:hypothetical protein